MLAITNTRARRQVSVRLWKWVSAVTFFVAIALIAVVVFETMDGLEYMSMSGFMRILAIKIAAGLLMITALAQLRILILRCL